VSSVQLGQWLRRSEGAAAEESGLAGQQARVFSVVDELPDVKVERVGGSSERDLELRFGGWAVWIRRIEA